MSPTATPPPARVPWTPALLGGALALGAVAQLALPPSPPPVEPTAAPARALRRLTAAVIAPAPAPPLDYPAILQRALFDPARSASALSAPGAAGPAAATFTLLGVALARGRAAAVVRDGAGAVHTLSPGEALAGWRLVSVGRERAALSDGTVVLPLRVGAPATAGAAPAAAGAPPVAGATEGYGPTPAVGGPPR